MNKIFDHLNEEAPIRMKHICSDDGYLYAVDANGVVYQFVPNTSINDPKKIHGYWVPLDMTTKPFEQS